MTEESKGDGTIARVVRQALSGRGSHALTAEVFDGLDWRLAGSRSVGSGTEVPHSVYRVLRHLVYWHDFALQWLEGTKPPTPRHAIDSWPGENAPAGGEEWDGLVARYREGLEALHHHAEGGDLLADRDGKTVLEILQMIASHDSYHAGQVATLRRLLDAWPPPGGGATW